MDSISFGQIEGLFDSPLKLPSLIDELPLGVVILDSDRRVLLLNRAIEVLSGFDREAVWGVESGGGGERGGSGGVRFI